MRATEDNGRAWDRWRARDYHYRLYVIAFGVFTVLAFGSGDRTAPLVCAFVASVAASIHGRLAEITASIHRRFDEQNARDRVQ